MLWLSFRYVPVPRGVGVLTGIVWQDALDDLSCAKAWKDRDILVWQETE